MKILLIETAPISKTDKNDSTVHVKNSIEIHRYLSKSHYCKLYSKKEDITDLNEQFDFIIFVSAAFYFDFASFQPLVDGQKNCKIGWLTNEFELFANDFIKERMKFIITNFEEHGVKKAHYHEKFLMTNLNTLLARPRNTLIEKIYDACYYGTFRKYRIPYFKKYFKDQLIVSTTRKNFKKFKDLEIDFLITDKFSWTYQKETLNLFKSSLYIEDTKTHGIFNYMANRFFEALFCNVAVFFDTSCLNTIKKETYEIDDYFIIDSYEELSKKTNNLDLIKLERFLNINTVIAIEQKEKTLTDIENFLNTY